MRILVSSAGEFAGQYGGGQVNVRNLVAELHRRGNDVMVFSFVWAKSEPEGVRVTRKSREGIAIREARLNPGRLDTGSHEALDSYLLEVVRSTVIEVAPDLVHANGCKEAFAKVCWELGVPCLVTSRHGGLVCPGGALLNADEEICREPVDRGRCLRCCLRGHPASTFWRAILGCLPQRMRLALGRLLEKLPNIPFVSPALKEPLHVERKLQEIEVLRSSGATFVAPSKAIQEALLRNGIPPERTVVVYHGVEPMPRRPLEPGLPGRPVRFVYVGRVNAAKGFHVLIDAMNRLPRQDCCEVHVAGEAASKWEKRYMRRVLRRLRDPSRLTLHGQTKREATWDLLRRCDVLILPTICLEVFGLVIPEAFSVGRPVIASRCGGPEEIVRDGIDGLLVERNDPGALAAAMHSLIVDPAQIERLASGIGHVRTMAEHVDELEKVYRRAIDEMSARKGIASAQRASAEQPVAT